MAKVRFFPGALKEYTVDQIQEAVEWADKKDCMVTVYGKQFEMPRRQAAYSIGCPGATYTFSGNKCAIKDMPPLLLEMRERVCAKLALVEEADKPNFVLVNLYEDGQHYIGFHRDNEAELDATKPIISTSHSAENGRRTFRLRKYVPPSVRASKKKERAELFSGVKVTGTIGKKKKEAEREWVKSLDVHDYELGCGDLLCLDPPTNLLYEHSILKTAKGRGPRINCTWRFLKY
jgi:alkylated DNA repair dioxygenase AlkB